MLVVLKEDKAEDTRGVRTLTNVKDKRIRSSLYNFAHFWDAMKVSTLANCWKKLLQDKDFEAEFKKFEAKDLPRLLQRGGETGPSFDEVPRCLEEQNDKPVFLVIAEENIVAFVTNPEENSSENEMPVKKVKLCTVKIYIVALLDYTTCSTIPETSSFYWLLRMQKELIIKEQHQVGRQTKVTKFSSSVRLPTFPVSDSDDFESLTSDTEAMNQE